jgi:predicted nucleotidyltransferase
MQENKPAAILRAMAEAGIEFIVVGGVAAVLNGAPLNTFDLDIVHARNAANVAKLLPLLDSLDAIFRFQPERRIEPTAEYLSGPGHLNLITRCGSLDLLGTIGRGLIYEDLLPRSADIEIAPGIRVRVLDLETLIALKEELGGEKDRAALPILRATLAEKRKL